MKPLGLPDAPRRRALIRTLAVSLLFSSAGDVVARNLSGASLKKFSLAQSIQRISGRVLVNGRSATPTTPIGIGDTVETASDAEVAFVVAADAYILKGGSRVVVGEPRSPLKNVMRFVTGKTATLPGAPKQGPIVARSSTIGIRN